MYKFCASSKGADYEPRWGDDSSKGAAFTIRNVITTIVISLSSSIIIVNITSAVVMNILVQDRAVAVVATNRRLGKGIPLSAQQTCSAEAARSKRVP